MSPLQINYNTIKARLEEPWEGPLCLPICECSPGSQCDRGKEASSNRVNHSQLHNVARKSINSAAPRVAVFDDEPLCSRYSLNPPPAIPAHYSEKKIIELEGKDIRKIKEGPSFKEAYKRLREDICLHASANGWSPIFKLTNNCSDNSVSLVVKCARYSHKAPVDKENTTKSSG